MGKISVITHFNGNHANRRLKTPIDQSDTIPAADAMCSPQCCAIYSLMNEPDFVEQREWTREIIENI